MNIFWQLLFKVLDLATTGGEFYSRCLSWPTKHFTAITQLVEFASRPPQDFSLKLTSEFAPERSFATVREVTNPKSTTNRDGFFSLSETHLLIFTFGVFGIFFEGLIASPVPERPEIIVLS